MIRPTMKLPYISAISKRHLLLMLWTSLHISAVIALFALHSDLQKAWSTLGYRAVALLAVLITLNIVLFMRLHSPDPACNGREAGICSSIGNSPMGMKPTPEFNSTSFNSLDSVALGVSGTAVRFCKRCSCWQPLIRCHHCKDCGRCIQGFDHHCFWLGTCVGDSNCLAFWCYLLSQLLLCMYALHHGFTAIRNTAAVPGTVFLNSQQLWSICFTAGLLLCTILIGCLLGFHSLLLVSNWKTYELIKGPKLPYTESGNVGLTVRSPFDRGPAANLYNLLFDRQLYNTINSACNGYKESAVHAYIWDNPWYSCC